VPIFKKINQCTRIKRNLKAKKYIKKIIIKEYELEADKQRERNITILEEQLFDIYCNEDSSNKEPIPLTISQQNN
jgi:hypothetical protein